MCWLQVVSPDRFTNGRDFELGCAFDVKLVRDDAASLGAHAFRGAHAVSALGCCVQEQLLRTQWPLQILEHSNAAHVTVEDVMYAVSQHARYEYLHEEVLQMLADKKADWVRLQSRAPAAGRCT